MASPMRIQSSPRGNPIAHLSALKMPAAALNTMTVSMSKKEEKTEESDASSEETNKAEEVDSEESEESASEEAAEESEENGTSKDKTDYEALDKEEKDRAKKTPDPLRAAEAFKARKAKRDEAEEGEESEEDAEEEDDKPLTRREAKAFFSGVEKTSQESAALTLARTHTNSEAEARAAVTFWKTRVIPTGDLEKDVMFAIGGLNHKKVLAKNSELARALKGKDGVSKDSASSHRDGAPGDAPKLSAQDEASYKRAGFSYDGKARVWKKKLPTGKFLHKDPKTKATWVR